ncbi:hypothetical protein QQS21_005649 [Conoideocrella luteorostrata]|uniref:Oxidase ustYa n=1 Tax=Conoideocrella luteorostrata TaxID=1105319 RepID=A0AAJ0CPD3_9HYPO|nr:hypothetical protein QQS21_005649 [Conoideocrella luteorostrata]
MAPILPSTDEGDGECLLRQHEKDLEPTARSSQSIQAQKWINMLTAVILSVVVGYLAGLARLHPPSTSTFGLPVPPGKVRLYWQHNITFTERPSPSSEAAWNSIIPVGRGFVHHHELAPFISNIAVFHQLHCLHAIVVAYYKALESQPPNNLTGVPDLDNNTNTRIAPSHVRHCFDYIRQALICAADTNLEVLDRDTHLTNGWGQPKQCRSYADVFSWAEKYANSSDTGILT